MNTGIPKPDKAFVAKIGAALFQLLREERKAPAQGLVYEGVTYSDSNPGWFNVALFLSQAIADSDVWVESNDMIAFVQQSLQDCRSAQEAEMAQGWKGDADWIELLRQIAAKLRVWLKRNNLPEECK